jgi:hypothetical protein
MAAVSLHVTHGKSSTCMLAEPAHGHHQHGHHEKSDKPGLGERECLATACYSSMSATPTALWMVISVATACSAPTLSYPTT